MSHADHLKELSLFTGAGGGVLGTKLLGWETVGYVENNQYCQNVLLQRIEDGVLDPSPVFGDIRDFNEDYAKAYSGMVDVITAGFPCQPFSVAGQQKGEDDERNLWPETIRCIRLVGPRFCLLENVPGLLAHDYFGTILGELAESGYDCRWRILSAAEVGAPHKRARLWIMAYAKGQRAVRKPRDIRQEDGGSGRALSRESEQSGDVADSIGSDSRRGTTTGRTQDEGRGQSSTERESIQPEDGEPCSDHTEQGGKDVANTDSPGTPTAQFSGSGDVSEQGCNNVADASCTGRSQSTQKQLRGLREKKDSFMGGTSGGRITAAEQGDWWSAEPELGRVAHGVAHRVDRIKAIGNGQVPAVVRAVWSLLNEPR